MEKDHKKILSCFQTTFDELFLLESIIKLTKESWLDREVSSQYYNLPEEKKRHLSEERNNYINMLSIALDRVKNLKDINTIIEEELGCL